MTDCPKHGVPMLSKQVDTARWEDACPVCEHQAFVELERRVAALWERLGMPVEHYAGPRGTLGETLGG